MARGLGFGLVRVGFILFILSPKSECRMNSHQTTRSGVG